jgi:hypothetical protein
MVNMEGLLEEVTDQGLFGKQRAWVWYFQVYHGHGGSYGGGYEASLDVFLQILRNDGVKLIVWI